MIRGRYRYCAGKPHCTGHFDEDFGAYDVECPICGAMDNNCANRRGLCLNCYCALANQIGEDAFAAMDMATLVRRGTAATLDALRRGTYTIEQRNKTAIAAFLAAHSPKPIVAAPPKEPTVEPRRTAAEESRDRVAKYGSGFKAEQKARVDRREYMRKYNAAHREEHREYAREYIAKNRRRRNARRREWGRANKERLREYNRKWREARKAKMKETAE